MTPYPPSDPCSVTNNAFALCMSPDSCVSSAMLPSLFLRHCASSSGSQNLQLATWSARSKQPNLSVACMLPRGASKMPQRSLPPQRTALVHRVRSYSRADRRLSKLQAASTTRSSGPRLRKHDSAALARLQRPARGADLFSTRVAPRDGALEHLQLVAEPLQLVRVGRLVLAGGVRHVDEVDLDGYALERARERLGVLAKRVEALDGDVREHRAFFAHRGVAADLVDQRGQRPGALHGQHLRALPGDR